MSNRQFLNTMYKFSKRNDSIKVSHTSLDPPRSFRVEEGQQRALLEEYCDLYGSGQELHIGEVLGDVRPLLIDIDISRPIKPGDEEGKCLQLYSVSDVEHTVRVIQDTIGEVFDGCDGMEELQRCVYLEKPSYFSRERLKNGFHLHFPYLFSNRKVFEDNLFPNVAEIINPYYNHKYGHTDVLDSNVNVWLMYGSNKPNEQFRYQVKTIYDADAVECGLEGLLHYPGSKADTVDGVERQMPYILSTKPLGRREVTCTIPLRRSHIYKVATQNDDEEKVDYSQNVQQVKQLMPLISSERASDYHSWIRIGWAIRASCGSGQESLQLWLDFSARCSDKYNERNCVRIWSQMKPKNISIGTIKYYAREDSPAKYSQLTVNRESQIIRNILSCTHYDVACLLHHEFKDQFMCSVSNRTVWYIFKNHHWNALPVHDPVDVYNCITEVFVPMLIELHTQVTAAGIRPGENRNANQNDLDRYWKLITNLKQNPYTRSIVSMCSRMFYVEKVENILDINPDLICFKNGVYDFTTKQLRPGLPSDYLTKQMPINYREFDMFGKEVGAVQTYLTQVFPDIQIREYFLTANSAIFRGGNMDKKILVWSGAGNNAKTVTQKILEAILGEYAACLMPAVINNGRPGSGQATPDLARIGSGVRQIFVQEPAKDKEINVDILKQLSGNDKIFARLLFENGREMTPMFKFAIICNELPDMPTADQAVWNRVRVIPFESTFTDNAPVDPEEQFRLKTFPIDRRFESKIPSLLEPFAFMLIQRFNETDGVPEFEPEKVRSATDNYQKCNDLIGLFIAEMIEPAHGFSISSNDMFNTYRDWFKDNSASKTQPTSKSTNDQIRLRLKVKTNDFVGFRFKSVDGLL